MCHPRSSFSCKKTPLFRAGGGIVGHTIDWCITTSYEKLIMERKSLIISTWSILKVMDEIV